MTDQYDTLPLPVRSIEMVSADGAHRRQLRVFCPVERRSLDLRTCGRCELCASFPKDAAAPGAELLCRIPRRTDPPTPASWFVGDEAISMWLPAGAVSSSVIVCASFDASIRIVEEALDRNAVGTAVILDEQARPLGAVGHSDLTARPARAALTAVDVDVPQIDEQAPLAEVISSLTCGRAHRVILVRGDGTVAGFVTEVDVLRWVAIGGSSW